MRQKLGLRVPEQRTRVCSFWQRGVCQRGYACSFLHTDPSCVSSSGESSSCSRECPPPVLNLGHPSLPRSIGRAMLHLGFSNPTAVQAQAWPAALCGLDLLCRAPTGSGKTLGYLLPAMAHVHAQPRKPKAGGGPAVLVLVPTRELVLQVHSTARSLKPVSGLRAVALYGGASREEQAAELEGATPLLVSTTGRLLDMLTGKLLVLSSVTMLVLDEGDVMIAQGFAPQVTDIVGQLRPDRQTLLFSATFPAALEAAAASWVRMPVRIYAESVPDVSMQPEGVAEAKSAEAKSAGAARVAASSTSSACGETRGVALPPASVVHEFVLCEGGQRPVLLSFLKKWLCAHASPSSSAASSTSAAHRKPRQHASVMVFVNSAKAIRGLARCLSRHHIKHAALHGNLNQIDREEALTALRSGKVRLLICTDVASRGLDIKHVHATVNFELPATIQTYVHRAGRCGRHGTPGRCVSLVPPTVEGQRFANDVAPLLERAQLPVPEVIARLRTTQSASLPQESCTVANAIDDETNDALQKVENSPSVPMLASSKSRHANSRAITESAVGSFTAPSMGGVACRAEPPISPASRCRQLGQEVVCYPTAEGAALLGTSTSSLLAFAQVFGQS